MRKGYLLQSLRAQQMHLSICLRHMNLRRAELEERLARVQEQLSALEDERA